MDLHVDLSTIEDVEQEVRDLNVRIKYEFNLLI